MMAQSNRSLRALFHKVLRDKRGNVLMIFGFSIIPLTAAVGIGVDYSQAARIQTKLNAIADAAALSAVTQNAMANLTDAQAQTLAQTVFNSQANAVPGVVAGSIQPTVTAAKTGTTVIARVAKVSYTARTTNSFGGLIGATTTSIGGAAQAQSVVAPNIDFYLALDTSPSMALPTTTAGFSTIDTAVKCSFACHSNSVEQYSSSANCTWGGCSLDSLVLDTPRYHLNKGNYGTGTDSGNAPYTKIDTKGAYVYSGSYSTTSTGQSNTSTSGNVQTTTTPTTVTTYTSRPAQINYVNKYPCSDNSTTVTATAVTTTVTTTVTTDYYGRKTTSNSSSKSTSTTTPYRDMCVYNSDGSYADTYWWAQNQNIRLRITDERAAVQNLMTVAANYATQNKTTYRAALYTFDHTYNYKSIASLTSSLNSVSTAAGNIDLALVNDKSGNGCPVNGPACQWNSSWVYQFTSFNSILTNMSSVLPSKSGNGTNTAGDTPQAFLFLVTDGMSDEDIGSGRTRAQMQQAQIDQCNTIKSRGVKIAILYTQYTASSIADDEASQKAFVTANIPKVAPALTACASPNLMYTVATDQDISAALQSLFSAAVASARIIK